MHYWSKMSYHYLVMAIDIIYLLTKFGIPKSNINEDMGVNKIGKTQYVQQYVS